MSAMEKVFVQIFERKNWIIDQLRQQADLYNQHLASKLLVEGVTPPPWLWNSNLQDSRECNREGMTSKLLFSHPNHGFPCSSGLSSLHNRLDVNGENIPLPVELSLKVHTPKSLGNIQGKLGLSPVLDITPQEKINLSNQDSCMRVDKSLVHVQRSKSRQRALELRSVFKRAADKSSTTISQEKDSELQEKLGFVPVLDMTSQEKINLSNPDSCMLADKLVDVQRSKSRQRALELRSASKRAAEKSSSSQEKDSELQEKLGFAPVLDMPPQEKIHLSNPDSCMLADMSLVDLQRSKSRLSILELRSASKRAAVKNSTSQETDRELQEKFNTSMAYSDRAIEGYNLPKFRSDEDMENSSSLSSLILQPSGVQNHLCGEMGLEAPNSDSFNYKGGCCIDKKILSPQQDGLGKKMIGSISGEIMRQENFNLPEGGLVNGKDGYLDPPSQMKELVKSCSHRGVMLTNNSYPQIKRRKIEGEKKRHLSASSIVLEKTIQNVMQDYVNVETSLEVSSQKPLDVSHDADTTQVELDGNPEVELHNKLIRHLTAGSELPPPVLQDEMGTREGDASSVIRMDFLGHSKLNKQSYSDSQCGAFSYNEDEEDSASLAFDELEAPLEGYGLQPSSSAAYTDKKDLESVGTDCIMPEFEGFTIDSETMIDELHLEGDMISFDNINLQNTMIERASFLEQLCISSSMCTPLPQHSTAFMLPETSDLYQSVPKGLLEQMNIGNSPLENDDISMQNKASLSCTQEEKPKNQEPAFSQCVTFSDYQFGWSSKGSCLPSVENLWDQMDLIPSKSSSSKKHQSSNPELTCFRIEEDPGDCSEESENADGISKQFLENSTSELVNSGYKREALLEMTESHIHGLMGQIAAEENRCDDKNSLFSEPSFTGYQKMVRQNPANRNNKKHLSEGKENCTLSIEVNRRKRVESSNKRFSKPKLSSKGIERQGGHRLFEKQSKQKNIVSSITSFLPLVQQKQAAAVCAGKKATKVRALETAKAAKRLEEKRKNERNMKKEALKLEQERLARQHLKQTELLRNKKKDADLASKRNQKEEEEKRAKERKRKCVASTRKQLEEQEVKLPARKGDVKIRPTIDRKLKSRESNDRLLEHQKMEKCTDHEGLGKTFDALGLIGECVGTTRSDMESPEKSYEISPYRNSDNEDEAIDVAPMKKFIPPWARKNSKDIALFLNNKIDPDEIFPPKSFSSPGGSFLLFSPFC